MTHKYKVIRFVNNKQICEWKEEKINPILYLNDFYNFIDKKHFDDAWGHGQGSKDETYDILKKHLEALEIIKEKRVQVHILLESNDVKEYNESVYVCEGMKYKLTQEEYELLKEVML